MPAEIQVRGVFQTRTIPGAKSVVGVACGAVAVLHFECPQGVYGFKRPASGDKCHYGKNNPTPRYFDKVSAETIGKEKR